MGFKLVTQKSVSSFGWHLNLKLNIQRGIKPLRSMEYRRLVRLTNQPHHPICVIRPQGIRKHAPDCSSIITQECRTPQANQIARPSARSDVLDAGRALCSH